MCLKLCQNSDITPIAPCIVLGIFWRTHAGVYAVLCRGPCLYLTLWRFDFSYLVFYFLEVSYSCANEK